MRSWKIILIEEEAVDSKSEFQDIQTYAAFDNDDEVIIKGSLSSRFNYQEEI